MCRSQCSGWRWLNQQLVSVFSSTDGHCDINYSKQSPLYVSLFFVFEMSRFKVGWKDQSRAAEKSSTFMGRHCRDKNTSQNNLFKDSFSRSHFHESHSTIFTEAASALEEWHVWTVVSVRLARLLTPLTRNFSLISILACFLISREVEFIPEPKHQSLSISCKVYTQILSVPKIPKVRDLNTKNISYQILPRPNDLSCYIHFKAIIDSYSIYY